MWGPSSLEFFVPFRGPTKVTAKGILGVLHRGLASNVWASRNPLQHLELKHYPIMTMMTHVHTHVRVGLIA